MKKLILIFWMLLLPSLCLSNWVDRNDPGDYNNIIDIGSNLWPSDVYVYQNQTNNLIFRRVIGGLVKGRIRVNGGSWSDWCYDFTSFDFNTTGFFTTLGEYTLDLEFYTEGAHHYTPTFTAHCVPSRYEFYYDNNGNFISQWKGGNNAYDRPILIVEGFDPTNENSPAKYYNVASNFMDGLRERDTDIFILNFSDGGADMVANAQIVNSAMNYLESVRSGNKKMVLCGVSMG